MMLYGCSFSILCMQIGECKKWNDHYRETWGYEKPNTEFLQGNVEDMAAMGLADKSFDVIV